MGLRDLAYTLYERRLLASLDPEQSPHHVGVILDGNRRWAKASRTSESSGHRAGADKIARLLEWCDEAGVELVTLWLLSTDNLARPEPELAPLLAIIEEVVGELATCGRWRIHPVGALDLLPQQTAEVLKSAAAQTRDVDGLMVNVAVGYGGRQEIADAVRSLLVRTCRARNAHGGPRSRARRRAHLRAPVHQGPAGPRPGHPHVRRAAALGLHAVAERAQRVLLLRGLLA